MSDEQQLERSVLERKERDELHAIAEAMGLKPASRTRKGDLIDEILRVTGVVTGSDNGSGPAASTNGDAPAAEPERPRRGRGSRAAAAASSAASESEAGDGSEATGSAATESGSAPTDGPGDAATGSAAAEGSAEGSGAEVGAGSGRADASQGSAAPSGPAGGTDTRNDHRSDGPSRAEGSERYQRFDGGGGEPGNRRNRRRRGRDRGTGGGGGGAERDLQGSGQEQQFQGDPIPVAGLLDLRDEGFGFLRAAGYLPSQRDVYVSISQVRRFALRKGDYVEGASRPAASNEKYPALLRIDRVSGMTPDEARGRPRFEDLTPLFPDQKLNLEVPGDAANMTARIVDLLSPIGKGQRGLIVSPPKAGKTTVLKQIAHSIEANNPEVHLMVLLVDERPEEVTDMRRSVQGEVVASTFDRPSEEHTLVAELAIDRAKRLVEMGKDVVIVLDGITRLARAYNLAAPASGRILSGGVDSGALYPPKKFFGSARNIEEGGSLTILATALVETGSRMDEVIFEEFKGTGNMELRLDRKLAERRIYPAIEVNASSTRHEELLFDRSELQQVWKLRRVLNALGSEGSAAAGLELLMDKIKTTKSNAEFLAEIAKGPTPPV
ncbi:MAG TPA: transcription termination factor Rho [Acidimicrobiales bacterium]|nr:transcription termination factor Rho [Acidimicrobiales bacterium]